MGCPYCYARRMYDRFKWDPTPRFLFGELEKIAKLKKPSGIFMCSTFEWLWDLAVAKQIMNHVHQYPQHRFYLLTKQPGNLHNFSPYPDNCYIGVTATDPRMAYEGVNYLRDIKAKVKFISVEPMLEDFTDHARKMPISIMMFIDWLIIGAQTGPYKPPKIEWVREIVEAADKVGIPVFLKDNIKPALRNKEGWTPALYVNARDCNGTEYLRQEFPNPSWKMIKQMTDAEYLTHFDYSGASNPVRSEIKIISQKDDVIPPGWKYPEEKLTYFRGKWEWWSARGKNTTSQERGTLEETLPPAWYPNRLPYLRWWIEGKNY